MLGGVWGACDPSDKKNRRRRSSIFVETANTRLLIDTPADLRVETGIVAKDCGGAIREQRFRLLGLYFLIILDNYFLQPGVFSTLWGRAPAAEP